MKTIATAVLLTVIGSGAVLAQGAPPGSPSWKTSALNSNQSSMTRLALAKKGETVPVA